MSRQLLVLAMITAIMAGSAQATDTSLGLGIGATAGFGGQVDLTFDNFTRNTPLGIRFSGAYSTRDAGNAMDARHVFINNNTNGTPETSASTWQMRMDLLFPLGKIGSVPLRIGAGVRKAYFTGTYDFVGGNEKFDVTSSPWGLGALLETALPMSDKVDFHIQLGVDYFFDSRLEGHDTAYEPDGDDVNPREDYTWEDADEAVNQPSVELLGLLGVRIKL